MRAQFRSQRGAALLILVAMLALGASALLIGAIQPNGGEARRQRETMATLAQAREALLGYALVHGRLPRPAVAADNGSESTQSCGDAAAACTGFLPWVTLGLPATDSWGKLLRYSVTPVFTEAPLHQNIALADKRLVSRDASGRLYTLGGHDQCDRQHPCVPAVIFSSGKHHPGVAVTGIPQLSEDNSNIDEQYNYSAVNDFILRNPTLAGARNVPGGEFDDLVIVLPLALLYQRMGVAGKLDD